MNPERFARLRSALQRRQPDLTLLMDGVNKSHNFSAILRNCDAVGVLEAHVVPPPRGLAIHFESSAGTKKWVSVRRHETVRAAASQLKEAGFTLLAAQLSPASIDYRDVDYTIPTAIVMGAELDGVSQEGLRLADEHVKIDMVGMAHSLNVSVATSLLLFEAKRQRDAAGMYEETRLSTEAFRNRLFEWAYPSIAILRQRAGRPYPKLSDDGEIVRE
jgi:tRNA (guanosine-2'-O-)-methyltransferase